MGNEVSSVSIGMKREEESLPHFTCATCSLADEDDNREDLGPVQATHAVQPQRQHTVSPLKDEEKNTSFLETRASKMGAP